MQIDRTTRSNMPTLWLLLFTILTLYSFLRGQRAEPEWAGIVYYVIDYSDGLIRRALIGQVFMLFYTRADSIQVWDTALTVHRIVAIVTMFGLLVWLWSIFWSERRFAPTRLGLVFLIFLGSQFLPTLAATNTYLDAYVFMLVLLGFLLASARRDAFVTGIGVIVPLIHEMSVILWFSLVTMVIWRDGFRALLRPWAIAMCASPFVSELLLLHFESTAALAKQLARAPLTPEIRNVMANEQMGHKLLAELVMMFGRFVTYPCRAAISILLFSAPTVVMVVLAAPALTRRDTIYLTIASFAPLTLLAVGFDLSRFVVTTQFTAMLSILFIASRKLTPIKCKDQGPSKPIILLALGGSGLLLLLPLVYGYFDTTNIVANEVLDNIPILGPHLRQIYAFVD